MPDKSCCVVLMCVLLSCLWCARTDHLQRIEIETKPPPNLPLLRDLWPAWNLTTICATSQLNYSLSRTGTLTGIGSDHESARSSILKSLPGPHHVFSFYYSCSRIRSTDVPPNCVLDPDRKHHFEAGEGKEAAYQQDGKFHASIPKKDR